MEWGIQSNFKKSIAGLLRAGHSKKTDIPHFDGNGHIIERPGREAGRLGSLNAGRLNKIRKKAEEY